MIYSASAFSILNSSDLRTPTWWFSFCCLEASCYALLSISSYLLTGSPVVPGNPVMPLGPRDPGTPGPPGFPRAPGGPGGPFSNPGGPFSPGYPSKPGIPCIPLSPETGEKEHTESIPNGWNCSNSESQLYPNIWYYSIRSKFHYKPCFLVKWHHLFTHYFKH